MDAREYFRGIECPEPEEIEAYAGAKVEEIAGGLAKALEEALHVATTSVSQTRFTKMTRQARAALAAYHEAVGHD